VWVEHPCNAKWSENGVTKAMLPLYDTGWTLACPDPITVIPSIHCNAQWGGCGLHGYIRDGKWINV
jgi:hypothetical protein